MKFRLTEKQLCRIIAFTFAPRMVDASGLVLVLFSFVVAVAAAKGWDDEPSGPTVRWYPAGSGATCINIARRTP